MFRYTGQAWLPELGMYHYKARTYSPTLGRFLQTDPIGYGGGMNMYNYVGNDPINRIDPLGLFAVRYKITLCYGDNCSTTTLTVPDPGGSSGSSSSGGFGGFGSSSSGIGNSGGLGGSAGGSSPQSDIFGDIVVNGVKEKDNPLGIPDGQYGIYDWYFTQLLEGAEQAVEPVIEELKQCAAGVPNINLTEVMYDANAAGVKGGVAAGSKASIAAVGGPEGVGYVASKSGWGYTRGFAIGGMTSVIRQSCNGKSK